MIIRVGVRAASVITVKCSAPTGTGARLGEMYRDVKNDGATAYNPKKT